MSRLIRAAIGVLASFILVPLALIGLTVLTAAPAEADVAGFYKK